MRREHQQAGPWASRGLARANALLIALPLLLLAACADDDPRGDTEPMTSDLPSELPSDLAPDQEAPPLEAWAEPGPHRAERENITIIDPVRTFIDRDGNDISRELPTAVWFPNTSEEPRPLLVWAHGLGSTREDSPRIARTMASRGWIVAAPNFPRTTRSTVNRDIGDVLNQPGDVSLVIDHMLARNADPTDPLHNTIDPSRIALGGVSLGALTVLITTWTPEYRDDRVGAVIALGGPACFMPRPLFESPPVPMLIMHGDADAVVDFESHSALPFADAPGPSIIVRLIDGSHTAMADNYGTLLQGTPQPDVVGCASVSISIEELAELSEALGGPDADTVAAECRAPCTGDELDRVAMNAQRQTNLVVQSSVAFLTGAFDNGPNIGTLAAQLDAEPDIEARAVSRHTDSSNP